MNSKGLLHNVKEHHRFFTGFRMTSVVCHPEPSEVYKKRKYALCNCTISFATNEEVERYIKASIKPEQTSDMGILGL